LHDSRLGWSGKLIFLFHQDEKPRMAEVNTDSAPARVPTSYKWWVIFLLWFVCFFNYADRQSISAVLPKLQEEFGFNKEEQGLIASAFMWVYAGGALLAGVVCDRFQRRHLIMGGCLFWSLVTMATAWCVKLWHFVTVRALEGFGETFYFPASMSLASDYHDGRTRSRALAFHQSSVYAGTILGSWLGAWLAEKFNWRAGFYLFGGAGMLLALVFYRFLKEPRRGQAEQAPSPDQKLDIVETAGALFRSPAVPLLMLAFAGANSVATVFLIWTPTFLFEKFRFGLSAAGLSATVYIHLASALAVPLAGLLADRWARRFVGGRVMVQALGLLGGAAFVFQVGRTTSVGTLILSMAAFGFCKGFYDSGIFASLYDAVEPRARGSAAGLMNTVGWGGGAFGPWFIGWLAKHGGRPTEIENMSDGIAWGSGIYLVSGALLIAAIWLLKRSRVSETR
jgi:MFS family permease